MGTVYRKSFTKPLPAGAEILTRQDARFARWKDAAGKTRTARLTTGKDGTVRIVVESRTFVAKYRDGSGIVRTTATGCRDETAARRMLGDFERRAELVKARVVTAAEDAIADHQGTPLAGHLAAYLLTLEAEGTSPAHRANVRRCLDRLAADCGFRRLGDLRRERLERWLVAQAKAGMGARTRNTYRAAAVAFGNWCIRNQRLTLNPFAAVSKANEAADTRKQRRALSEDELRRLLYVARLRPLAEYGRATVRRDGDDQPDDQRSRRTWRKASLTLDNIAAAADLARERLADNPDFLAELVERGRARALLYKTAVLTGLRRGELASLTVGSLDLAADPPCLTLAAADEKSREGNTLPLRSDLAAELREWLADRATTLADAAGKAPTLKLDSEVVPAGKRARRLSVRRQGQVCQPMTGLPLDAPVFQAPRSLIRRLDLDLRAAGIAKVDERGWTVDVHALRHTFGTLLSATGTAPRTAQAALRHSDIGLTMNTYTDPRLLDVAGAIDRLPDLPLDASPSPVERRSEVATGTDGKPIHAAESGRCENPGSASSRPRSQLAPPLAPTSDILVQAGSFPDKTAADDAAPRNAKNVEKTSVFPAFLAERATSFELATSSLEGCDTVVPSGTTKGLAPTASAACTTACTNKPENAHAVDLQRLAADLRARLSEADRRRLAELLLCGG